MRGWGRGGARRPEGRERGEGGSSSPCRRAAVEQWDPSGKIMRILIFAGLIFANNYASS